MSTSLMCLLSFGALYLFTGRDLALAPEHDVRGGEVDGVQRAQTGDG